MGAIKGGKKKPDHLEKRINEKALKSNRRGKKKKGEGMNR